MNVPTKRKNIRNLAILICVIAVIAGAFLTFHSLQERHRWAGHESGTGPEERPEYAGLKPRKEIETFLVIGLDKFEADPRQIGYLNDRQADFLTVMVLDKSENICHALQLNRDTMTEIRRLGIGGKEAGTFVGQLALAHTYGSGGSDSCVNTVRAVSQLLDGVRIDHYVSMTMDAVPVLNDLVGGVTITVEEDFSDENLSLRQGETVCFRGDQALRYVRARGGLEDSSNLARMERQQQYMRAFYHRFTDAVRADEDFFADAWAQAGEYIQTDCTSDQLQQIIETADDLKTGQIYTLKGEAKTGEEFMEFYPDEAAKKEVIKDLFSNRLTGKSRKI